uniref:Uncharacterized protein LOC105075166 isoform X2 n=1 Tax=Camelus bactrianus TaxID=9837 RepID=A0A9W3GGG3_CAMBA|nr:uncharacterized protein LOC105075166 isoform X2 [Camelus bactrianus]
MINPRKRSGCLIKEQIIYLSRKSVQHNPERRLCWPRRVRRTSGKRNCSSALVNRKNAAHTRRGVGWRRATWRGSGLGGHCLKYTRALPTSDLRGKLHHGFVLSQKRTRGNEFCHHNVFTLTLPFQRPFGLLHSAAEEAGCHSSFSHKTSSRVRINCILGQEPLSSLQQTAFPH